MWRGRLRSLRTFRSEWPDDWPLIVAAVARYYGGGFDKAEALTLGELRWWHNCAAELERLAAEAAKQR